MNTKHTKYCSTREAMKNGQKFPSIFWVMTPGVILVFDNGEYDMLYPDFMSLNFEGLPLGDPFEGISIRS